ncbi:hypothetical protein [Treponema succinifaciens]|uniref:hypothetical protein n=1 Tax=Treponema succinifaciens TaxID=167 RepID=UPI0023F83B21|nr:hypothetical protein [Treponema succinifaciens]
MRKTSLFVFIFSVLFFSCSQDSAQIASAESSVIFDYSQNPPDMRLSVFVNSESDVRLASKIKIVNKNSGLEWNCDELVKFEDKNKNSWTGCANIVAAFGMKIPAGEYVLTYFDMAGDEDEILFSIDYPENVLTLKSEDFPDGFDYSEKKSAIYTKDGVLLYYGEEKKEWENRNTVLVDYKDAGFIRPCYTLKNDSVICLMPPENLEQQ